MLENALEWPKPVPVHTFGSIGPVFTYRYGGVGVGPLLDFRATSFKEKKKYERKKKVFIVIHKPLLSRLRRHSYTRRLSRRRGSPQ